MKNLNQRVLPGHASVSKVVAVICFLCLSLGAFAQGDVKGKVTDNTGAPLPGATVVVKGTAIGVSTDNLGNYSIRVPNTDAVLEFQFIGKTPKSERVGNQTTINVTLDDDIAQLEELVVVGYGSVRRQDVTTAVSTVSTKDLAERPIIDVAAAIQGKAAGVQVIQPNGQPGAGMVVRVRGTSSITASNDPLYVVDDVPVSSIDYLTPNDIESMQILKDASAAAIYGSRASNGVVLITTKRGTIGQAKISFNSYVGITQVMKSFDVLNHEQYKELQDEIGLINIPDGLKDETDWFTEAFQNGVAQNYQLSVSNANKDMRYYISGGYTDETGVLSSAFSKRYNFRANVENQIRPWLRFGANVAYADNTSNGIISGQGANRAGVVLSVINTPTFAKIWNEEKPGEYWSQFYGANVTHPIANLARTKYNKGNSNRLIASANAEITFAPFLKFKSTVSFQRNQDWNTSFLDPIETQYGRAQYGEAYDSRSQSTVMVYDNLLNFNKSFGKHNITALAGTSGTTSKWNSMGAGSNHFANGIIKTLNGGNKASSIRNSSSLAEWAIFSYLARATYNYDSKYLFTANFRADGSSRLAPKGRWGYFPSFSAAWRISAEEFMKSATWVDDLKLRAGWGQVGNQSGIGDYSYLQTYGIVYQNWTLPEYANWVPQMGSKTGMINKSLTWETTTSTNIGVDLTVLDGRITFSADAYYKYTKNLLMSVPLPAPANNITRNEGEMSNRGLEFTIDARPIVKNNFTWDINANISMNRNKLEKLSLQQVYYYATTSESTSENLVRMVVGKPLGMFWGYINQGVDPETGNLIFKDLDENERITTGDKCYIGDPNPDFTFGMTNTFSYKGINLNVFLQGSVGNDIYNASRIETEGMYNTSNQTTEVLNRWKIPGQITDIPRSGNVENLRSSTRFIENGSYLRVKAITLSYNFAGSKLRKANISRLQPYITLQNFFTLTNYSGFDPEVNQYGGSATVQGIDWGTYPQVKTVVFGLNIEF